jgi:DnaJ like chaperone protein
MGIIGKIVGGTLGFALGGPLGGIAGAVFGHAFDRDADTFQQEKVQHLSAIEESQLAFFVSTFSMLAKLVKADGQVSQKELDVVEKFAAHDIGLSGEHRRVALNLFSAALESPASFEDFAVQFSQRFSGQSQLIEMMIDILLRVSVADGRLTTSEEALILSAVRIFGLNEGRYTQIKSRYVDSADKAYQILGCRKEDSNEQIKKQYRTLVHSYHPDKVLSKGLPDEFVELAHDKFREIQAAYEQIRKERGF